MAVKIADLPVTDRDKVRMLWLQRCRMGASVPKYLIVELELDKVFEFMPDSINGDFYFACREKTHGPPQANP